MATINKNHILVFLSLIISTILCIGHITENRILVMLSMALFLSSVIWTTLSGKVLYLICFFLPWATLIKFEPKTMSIYTVGLIAACLLTWIRYKIPVWKYTLPALALIIMMLIVRLFYGFGIDNSFIMFCIMLLFFPTFGADLHKTYDFYHFLFFFSLGIISAALSAFYLVKYPTIAQFINVFSVQDVTRYSGYYGDANFYSSHIAAAIAGYLVMFIDTGRKKGQMIFALLILLYCGLLSASKSFVITVSAMLLLWVLQILRTHKKISYKTMAIVVIIAIAIAIIGSNVFTGLFAIIAIRFGNAATLSDLTTGRSTIWMNYFQYFANNPGAFLLGKGFTNVLVEGDSPHNTVIQGIYQFGVVGFIIFVFWLKNLFKITLQNLKIERKQYLSCFILMLGVFLPWMSIDLLFFDEFFLMMFYVSLGLKWFHNQSSEVV